MAKFSSTGAGAPDKPYSHSFQTEAPVIVSGLVQHALVSASTQVQILSVIDETGSATIGDTIAELPDHPDPVEAVMAMVRLNILVLDLDGVLDANTVVRRADPEPDPGGATGFSPNPQTRSHCAHEGMVPSNGDCPEDFATEVLPEGIDRVPMSRLSPCVLVGPDTHRRDFARIDALRRPGVYVLLSGNRAYVGMGADVGRRVASGSQRIEDVDTIITLTDAHDGLSDVDALVLERMLHTRLSAAREVTLVNDTPGGGAVTPERYGELNLFAAMACDALAREEHLFVNLSPRMLLAGPRAAPGQIVPQRLFNQAPDGEVMELTFGKNCIALAARRADDEWLLLRGSDIRLDTVPSANASASYLRAAWFHSGILQLAHDGKSYTLTRDMPFRSASAAMHFVVGSKGQGRGGWQPIDPDGGYDPETPVLIAS